MKTKNQVKRVKRGKSRFGSSDAYWLQAIDPQHTEITLYINGRSFSGLLDMGKDRYVITASQWPSTWPTRVTITQLQGTGQLRILSRVAMNLLGGMKKVMNGLFSHSLFLIHL